MQLIGIVGWSGSGKTTLIAGLLPELIARGHTVSTLKHAHKNFDIDKPGKDSFRHREAGATEVMICTGSRWALMHELRDEGEVPLEQLVEKMTPVDILVVEGFKSHAHAKIEVYRKSVGKPLLQPADPHIIAVASDEPLPSVPVPVLDINDPASVARFILDHLNRQAA